MVLLQSLLLSVAAAVALAAPAVLEEAQAKEAENVSLMHTEIIKMVTWTLQLLEHLELDEFILLLTTIFPVTAGLIAALRAFTNHDGQGGEHDAERALSIQTEAALTKSASTVNRLEQQVTDLQRQHDTRFADLHKDLAGIVWELSKLRADMARWQALAQLRGSSRSSSVSANGATLPSRMSSAAVPAAPNSAGAAPHALPATTVLPPDTRLEAPPAFEGGEDQTANARQEAAGAHAWRSSGP
mmetsp:Transcript_49873/g.99227  ORF Transcript_49873/g.99227 Transcript_49873/m.99227 type:complete len:243 (-) Transcript_49873:453-1181(-)